MDSESRRTQTEAVDLLTFSLGISLLILFCLLGLVLLVLGLPGTFLIAGAAAVYGWATGFASLTTATVVWLFVMAVAGEVIEFASAAAGGRAKASRRVTIAAIAGAVVGGIFGAPFFFGVGALLGALGGAFAGATLAATAEGKTGDAAIRHGVDALRGRLLGFIVKSAIAVAMTVVAVGAAI